MNASNKKKEQKLLVSLTLYLVLRADILVRSSQNEMDGFVYNIRVTDL